MAWTVVVWNSVSCNGSGKKCWSYSSSMNNPITLDWLYYYSGIAAKVVTIIINEYFL